MQLVNAKACKVPADDYVTIAGNFNAHVGEKTDGTRRRREKEFGAPNEGGESTFYHRH